MPMKVTAHKAKAHFSSKLFTLESIQRAQQRMLTLKKARAAAASPASKTERAQRCSRLVDAALSALDETDDNDSFPQASPSSAQESPSMPSAESLYGYEELPSPPAPVCVSKMAGRRRYQRRCSVTEFSLKAAVLAKVQLSREGSL
jgi:hypothetical protein